MTSLQLRRGEGGKDGARETFERLIAQLVRPRFRAVKRVEAKARNTFFKYGHLPMALRLRVCRRRSRGGDPRSETAEVGAAAAWALGGGAALVLLGGAFSPALFSPLVAALLAGLTGSGSGRRPRAVPGSA